MTVILGTCDVGRIVSIKCRLESHGNRSVVCLDELGVRNLTTESTSCRWCFLCHYCSRSGSRNCPNYIYTEPSVTIPRYCRNTLRKLKSLFVSLGNTLALTNGNAVDHHRPAAGSVWTSSDIICGMSSSALYVYIQLFGATHLRPNHNHNYRLQSVGQSIINYLFCLSVKINYLF